MKLKTDIYVDAIDDANAIFNDEFEMMEHLTYPFVDSLKMNVDDEVELPLDSRVEMCIYRINYSHHNIPFLEFLLYSDGNKNDKDGVQLIFPYILSKHSKGGLVDQCSVALRALFSTKFETMVRYNGFIYMKREKRCVLFFNQLHVDVGDAEIPFMSSKKRWWWTLSSEIFNDHKMMGYSISDAVVEFFNKNIEIMILKANGKTLESPNACYAGKHFNYVSYMASFGMKKASTRAHFGPYYYFVRFMDSMKHACYSIRAPYVENKTEKQKKFHYNEHILADGTSLTVNEYGKHTRGGIVRFAVFLGRCRAFFMNGEEDRSDLSMYWAKQDPLVMAKLALRDINGNWSRFFNAAYVGEYEFDAPDERKSKRAVGWTIKEYENQIPLSCHEIDMSNVPDKYDSKFTDYVIL